MINKTENIILVFVLTFTTIISAQIKPGVYRLDYKYIGEENWTIMDYNIEVFKDDGRNKYTSFTEDGECIVYESESNWKENNNKLIISNIEEKHRDKCFENFKISSLKTSDIYHIIVSKKDFFIGQNKEDQETLLRWVKLNTNNNIFPTELQQFISEQKKNRLNTIEKKNPLELLLMSATWQTEYIIKQNKKRTIESDDKNWFKFKSNGQCEIANGNDIVNKKWVFNEKRKSVYIKISNEFQEFKIEKINDNKIILSMMYNNDLVKFGLKN
ncbi:hypothetical protein [uncultured Aquimarina sp.]|uniref:hypothetical protein n=1 Tax=uncultured Aquimarina sp. TaxID=575652 RepID=UPI0026073914|nr:hypothetical protein [uncultured Aquimarina sp.]